MQPGDLNAAMCHPLDGKRPVYIELIIAARCARDATCCSVSLENGVLDIDQAATSMVHRLRRVQP